MNLNLFLQARDALLAGCAVLKAPVLIWESPGAILRTDLWVLGAGQDKTHF
jgi:hypothetical protein